MFLEQILVKQSFQKKAGVHSVILLFIKHCQNEQIKDQEVGGA
jgi:hypothetical protein